MTGAWDELIESWMLVLRVGDVGEATRNDYLRTLRYYRKWLDAEHPNTSPDQLTRKLVAGYLDHLAAVPSAHGRPMSLVTIGNRYRHLQQWCRWLAEDPELYAVSPMHGMRHPHRPERLVPAIDAEDILAVLGTCEGTGFAERRDKAIMMVFLDTGVRRAELANVDLADVDMRRQQITVIGKGDKQRTVPFGATTAVALDRYKRARTGHAAAVARRGDAIPDADALWLTVKGGRRLSADGLRQMLERRSAQAGIPHARAHRWRHTMATEWMVSGGNELDLQAIMGWTTLTMARRYTEEAKAKSAAVAHKRHGSVDRMLGTKRRRAG
jgi:site-specific recombinase XerD